MKTDNMDYSKFIEKKINEALTWTPSANRDVLEFIFNFAYCNGINEEAYEHIRSAFRAGYCYYFANMLKLAFNRGECCLAAPFGHIIWVDEDDTPYDIEGVYTGEATFFIPISYLGVNIEDFMHVPDKNHYNTKEECMDMIYKYCKDKDLLNKECTKKSLVFCKICLNLDENWEPDWLREDMNCF